MLPYSAAQQVRQLEVAHVPAQRHRVRHPLRLRQPLRLPLHRRRVREYRLAPHLLDTILTELFTFYQFDRHDVSSFQLSNL